MTNYLLKRLLRGLLSVIAVVAIVMLLIYSLMNRDLIFAKDPSFSKMQDNSKELYKYQQWESYGYLDYVPYADWLKEITANGEITEDVRKKAVAIAAKAESDNDTVKEYVAKFTEYYESKGYTVVRLDKIGKKNDANKKQQLFAYKDTPLIKRMFSYFGGVFKVDSIHKATGDVGERKLTFTLHDPVYGGSFAPAIMGNGTLHKYLLYFDGEFPYIHQNVVTVNLGKSYTVNKNIDIYTTMTKAQGGYVNRTVTYPTGLTEEAADNLHTATYAEGSRDKTLVNADRFTDDYTNVEQYKANHSRIGYSFIIGILSTILSYLLGVPLGILMARKKDKLIDKIGTLYIVFIIAVPSLAYIFIFKAVGRKVGLPDTFIMDKENALMYILPIVSLALPSVAGLMKWLRRYMIDQMSSDYVKFARSGGLTENEIFSKHILKNAIIPLVHGIPASILGALTGAIITESVYNVPGTGRLLTNAINAYDNSVIVGVTLFYALLSVISLILGDILMSLVDPRISFSSKAR